MTETEAERSTDYVDLRDVVLATYQAEVQREGGQTAWLRVARQITGVVDEVIRDEGVRRAIDKEINNPLFAHESADEIALRNVMAITAARFSALSFPTEEPGRPPAP